MLCWLASSEIVIVPIYKIFPLFCPTHHLECRWILFPSSSVVFLSLLSFRPYTNHFAVRQIPTNIITSHQPVRNAEFRKYILFHSAEVRVIIFATAVFFRRAVPVSLHPSTDTKRRPLFGALLLLSWLRFSFRVDINLIAHIICSAQILFSSSNIRAFLLLLMLD